MVEKSLNQQLNAIEKELLQLKEQLHIKDLQLCELDIENVALRQERDALLQQVDSLKSYISLIENSKTWRLRKSVQQLLSHPSPKFSNPQKIKFSKNTLLNPSKVKPVFTQEQKEKYEANLNQFPQILIQAHVYYPELIFEICKLLSNIPYPYDLYITTTEEFKKTYIIDCLERNCTANYFYVDVLDNKGRDVRPLLLQANHIISQYKYLCHIHTKKSLFSNQGNKWRNYLFNNLLGSKEIIQEILFSFENDPKLGLIFPEIPEYILPYIGWAANKKFAEQLMDRMNLDSGKLPENIIFPAGNMFWTRVDAVKDIFEINYEDDDFPEEANQIDGTVMHAIERLWVYIAEQNGYTYLIKEAE